MRRTTTVLLLLATLAGPVGAFGYLFTRPAELRQLVGESDKVCVCKER